VPAKVSGPKAVKAWARPGEAKKTTTRTINAERAMEGHSRWIVLTTLGGTTLMLPLYKKRYCRKRSVWIVNAPIARGNSREVLPKQGGA
jgi:hypothetical protein